MKKLLAVLLAVVMMATIMPIGIVSHAYSSTRDDGVWLFPLPSNYYNNFSDWAGCPGNGKCVFCGVTHSGWGDDAHTGQGGHNGFDVAAPAGTNVYAAASGVAYSFYNSARGNTVVIEHKIGNGYSYYTYYQHLNSFSISSGQNVSVGDVIGTVGNTGQSGGNHLHFGMLLSVAGENVNNAFLNKIEGLGWVVDQSKTAGRILNNPVANNDAGFPKGQGAVVPPLAAHYGSVHYTFDKNKVTIGGSVKPIKYASITEGDYYIKNTATDKNLDVDGAIDAQAQNIVIHAFHGEKNQLFKITKSGSSGQYMLRPHSSSSRVVNVYADNVVSGKNVCIYDNTGHDSQRWRFEKVSGGYVIRNAQNPSCVLDIRDGCDVYVNVYSGAKSQIWTLERKCDHKYSNNCDKTCNKCGQTRTVGSHKYSNSLDMKCNVCGAIRTHTHTYKTTTTKATLTKNGGKVKKCTKCDYVASKTTIKYPKTIKLSTTQYLYNGKAKKPSVIVKDASGKTLKKNTDYTVTYASGRKNVGNYKVTVKFKGNYSGTKTLNFKIFPPKTSVKNVAAAKKSVKVTLNKKTTQVSGYQVQYSLNKTFKNAKVKTITSNKTTSITIKNLKTKKSYYVRVRTYKTVGKSRYYSAWSASKKTKTK